MISTPSPARTISWSGRYAFFVPAACEPRVNDVMVLFVRSTSPPLFRIFEYTRSGVYCGNDTSRRNSSLGSSASTSVGPRTICPSYSTSIMKKKSSSTEGVYLQLYWPGSAGWNVSIFTRESPGVLRRLPSHGLVWQGVMKSANFCASASCSAPTSVRGLPSSSLALTMTVNVWVPSPRPPRRPLPETVHSFGSVAAAATSIRKVSTGRLVSGSIALSTCSTVPSSARSSLTSLSGSLGSSDPIRREYVPVYDVKYSTSYAPAPR